MPDFKFRCAFCDRPYAVVTSLYRHCRDQHDCTGSDPSWALAFSSPSAPRAVPVPLSRPLPPPPPLTHLSPPPLPPSPPAVPLLAELSSEAVSAAEPLALGAEAPEPLQHIVEEVLSRPLSSFKFPSWIPAARSAVSPLASPPALRSPSPPATYAYPPPLFPWETSRDNELTRRGLPAAVLEDNSSPRSLGGEKRSKRLRPDGGSAGEEVPARKRPHPLDPGREEMGREEDLFAQELPLPHYFSQLPELNQRLVRAARMATRVVKPAVWDWKKKEWVRPDASDSRGAGRQVDPADENDNQEDEEDDLLDADGLPEKRRRTGAATEGRFFEIKKWVPIPAAVAEKMSEPKYLADRRPGMPSLYGNTSVYKATNGYGTLGPMPAAGYSNGPGYDLGDGAGLGNATGVLSGSGQPATPTPRRNMPPIRKSKKRKGGPGRRKAVPIDAPVEESAVTENENETTTHTPTVEQEQEQEGDSEGDGSEEGEVMDVDASTTQIEPQSELEVDTQTDSQTAPEATVEEPSVTAPEPEPEPQPTTEADAEVSTEITTDVVNAMTTTTDIGATEESTVNEINPSDVVTPAPLTTEAVETAVIETETIVEPPVEKITELEPEPEPVPEPIVETTAETVTDDITNPVTEPAFEPRFNPVAQPVVEPLTPEDPEPEPEPEPEAEPDVQTEVQIEVQTEIQTEAQPEVQAEAQIDVQTEAHPEPQLEPQSEHVAGTESEAEATDQPENPLPVLETTDTTKPTDKSDDEPKEGEVDLLGNLEAAVEKEANETD
ncbi:hypothetical protein LTS17_005002 [Exophiala oligosperma]